MPFAGKQQAAGLNLGVRKIAANVSHSVHAIQAPRAWNETKVARFLQCRDVSALWPSRRSRPAIISAKRVCRGGLHGRLVECAALRRRQLAAEWRSVLFTLAVRPVHRCP